MTTDFAASKILCEFLEIAVNAILYSRDIYPRGSFDEKKKYGIPVQICVHAEVRSYVDSILESLHIMMQSNKVHLFCILILDSTKELVEKFVFEVSALENLRNIAFGDLLSLEQDFRSLLLKLYTCNSVMCLPVKDCTWKVEIHLQHAAFLEVTSKQLLKNMFWLVENEMSQSSNSCSIVPLKSISYSFLQLQMYIQEMNRCSQPS